MGSTGKDIQFPSKSPSPPASKSASSSSSQSFQEQLGLTDEQLEQCVFDYLSSQAGPAKDGCDELHADLTRAEKSHLRYDLRSSGVPSFDQHACANANKMEDLLRVSVSVMLKELGMRYVNNSALEGITDLAAQYMGLIIDSLHEYTEIQRRHKPSKTDVCLLLKQGYFTLADVVDQHNRCQRINGKYAKLLTELNNQARSFTDTQDGEPSKNDPMYVFMHETTSIVRPEKRLSFIPKWMPSFPPEYTYKATPTYSKCITSARELRSKLIVEGRLGEKALHHITEVEGGSDSEKSVEMSISESESDSESGNEHKEMPHGLGKTGKVEESKQKKEVAIPVPAKEDTKFDIVEYMKKRLSILKERELKKQKAIKARENSSEAIFGRYLGSYTKHEAFPPHYHEVMEQYMKSSVEKICRSMKRQRKREHLRAEEVSRKRRKLELEKQKLEKQNSIEVGGFAGGDVNSDEEEDFDMEFSDAEAIDDLMEGADKDDKKNEEKKEVHTDIHDDHNNDDKTHEHGDSNQPATDDDNATANANTEVKDGELPKIKLTTNHPPQSSKTLPHSSEPARPKIKLSLHLKPSKE